MNVPFRIARIKRVVKSHRWANFACSVGLAFCVVACDSSKEEESIKVSPLTDSGFVAAGSVEEIKLGRLLFFDKVLSGNENISCATCHHPKHGSSDGLSLGVGEGGVGLGPSRTLGEGSDAIEKRVPRNSPALFNLGAKEVQTVFHDGRIFVNSNQASGFSSPAGSMLPFGLKNIVAAQALFPVSSPTEMAGQGRENEVAIATNFGFRQVWATLVERIRGIPKYVELFSKAYSHIREADDIQFKDVGNAIAAFEIAAFKSIDSPYDQFLRGETSALNEAQLRGKEIFYGKGKCATCHSGPLLTDHKFHVVGFPQVGPGTGGRSGNHQDFGREAVSGRVTDRYKFKTPSLKNVELTAPYGHAGTFATLQEVVSFHADPALHLPQYTGRSLIMKTRPDFALSDMLALVSTNFKANILSRLETEKVALGADEIEDIVQFLKSLTDPASEELMFLVPTSVPSELPVED